jgi:hypothetical protein
VRKFIFFVVGVLLGLSNSPVALAESEPDCDGADFCRMLQIAESTDKGTNMLRKAFDRASRCKPKNTEVIAETAAPNNPRVLREKTEAIANDIGSMTTEESMGVKIKKLPATKIDIAAALDGTMFYFREKDPRTGENCSGKINFSKPVAGTVDARGMAHDGAPGYCPKTKALGSDTNAPDPKNRLMIKCGDRILWAGRNFEELKKGDTTKATGNNLCIPYLKIDHLIAQDKKHCIEKQVPFLSWKKLVDTHRGPVFDDVPLPVEPGASQTQTAPSQQGPVQKNDGVK